jgi:hypothetical protein
MILMYIGVHVQYPLFLWDFNETWIFSADFRKVLKIKFRKNPSSESRVVPCQWPDRRTNISNLIIAFRNFAKAPRKSVCKPNKNIRLCFKQSVDIFLQSNYWTVSIRLCPCWRNLRCRPLIREPGSCSINVGIPCHPWIHGLELTKEHKWLS